MPSNSKKTLSKSKLAQHPNYVKDTKDFEVLYAYITQNTRNARALAAAFLNNVNKDLAYKVAFHEYMERTRKAKERHLGRRLFTTFSTLDQLKPVDGLLIFVDSATKLSDFVEWVKDLNQYVKNSKLRITVISNEDNLLPNEDFEKWTGITPTYESVQLIQAEKSIVVSSTYSINTRLSTRRVTEIITKISNDTLDTNETNIQFGATTTI